MKPTRTRQAEMLSWHKSFPAAGAESVGCSSPWRAAVLVISGAIACLVGCGQDQKTATVAHLAEVPFSDQLAEGRQGRRDRVELFADSVDDESLAELTPDDDWLETLILDAGEVTDRGAESIASLPSLIHLRLRQSPITDQGMRAIARCESIRILNLPQSDATARGIAALAELPKLQNLRLGGARFDSDTADAIADLVSLRQIHLIGVPIDDEGLKQIAALPDLQSLYLDDSAVTQAGWDWLFENHSDLHIHVNQRHLDREHDHR